MTGTPTRRPGHSVRLVGEPQQLAELGIDAARPGSGSARRSDAGQPAASASSADVSACVRRRSRAGRSPAAGAPPPDPGAVGLGQRVGDARPDPGLALAARRGAARRAGRRARCTRSARREATTSRPCRRSATCIDRTARAARGRSRPPAPSAPPGATRARTCARNWRTLTPTRRLKIASKIGRRIRPPIAPPGGRKNRTIRMMKPYCSRIGRTWYAVRRSRNANRTSEPSSGGIGIRLKSIRKMLIWTKRTRMSKSRPT